MRNNSIFSIYITQLYLIFFIIIFLINFYIGKCILVLPIETLSEDNFVFGTNMSSHQIIMKKSLFKSLYTIIEIGTPIQKIPLFINSEGFQFEITSITNKKYNITNQYKLTYNLTSIFKKYEFFNENKSSTFKTEGCVKDNNMLSDHLEDCFSNDIVFLYNDINMENKIDYKNFYFNMVTNKEENITGVLGLGLFDKSKNLDKSLMKLLKEKKIINNYNWYFSFNSWNDTNGKLIIGSLPHEDFPNMYSEKDLLYSYMPLDYFSTFKIYKIEFDNIYTSPNNSSFNIKIFARNAHLAFDTNIIIGPSEFEEELNSKFLQEFIMKGKCFKDKFKQALHYYTDLNFYYCDISLKGTLYEILPSIKFFSKDFNYTFELTKDELFKIEGNYIYIQVLFNYIRQTSWIIGRSLTLKYPFVFNSDNNKIGFYRGLRKPISNDSDSKNNNLKIIILVVAIVVFSFLLVFLGIFIGKKLYGIHRKKRANELNENYEYIVDDKGNNAINE